MRGLLVFVCGALVGLMLETDRPGGNPGVFMLNHINLNVEDIAASADFYTRTMGYEQVYSLANAEGEVGMVFLDVGDNTFLKLTTAGSVGPRGFTNMAIAVRDLESAKAMYQSRGARLSDTFEGRNQEVRAYLTDPQGIPIELFEYPAGSELDAVLTGVD